LTTAKALSVFREYVYQIDFYFISNTRYRESIGFTTFPSTIYRCADAKIELLSASVSAGVHFMAWRLRTTAYSH